MGSMLPELAMLKSKALMSKVYEWDKKGIVGSADSCDNDRNLGVIVMILSDTR